ncbi:MAG: TPM domain-containing protein [Candidatus Cloacimonadales bacterium]
MIKLTAQNKEQISKAVTEAEKSTSGEIAVVVAKQSSDYAVYELTFAVIIGLIFMILGLIFYSEIDTMIMNMIWSSSKIITTSVIGLGTFVVIILFYILANIPFIDRLIIPKSIKNEKVREKAQLSFMNYEVGKTRDRTGILIFISKLERRVEILADVGISAVYPHDSWQKQVDRIIAGIKNKQFSEELEKVILDLGQVLAKNFPIKDDNTNELPNKVREI